MIIEKKASKKVSKVSNARKIADKIRREFNKGEFTKMVWDNEELEDLGIFDVDDILNHLETGWFRASSGPYHTVITLTSDGREAQEAYSIKLADLKDKNYVIKELEEELREWGEASQGNITQRLADYIERYFKEKYPNIRIEVDTDTLSSGAYSPREDHVFIKLRLEENEEVFEESVKINRLIKLLEG